MIRSIVNAAKRVGSAQFALVSVGLLLILFPASSAQGPRRGASAGAAEEASSFREIRGVQLGMTSDDVRKKLGDPKDKSDEQDFFIFGETETAQVLYDKGHRVITISVDFISSAANVPTPKDVFGAEIEKKADGSIYKMVRYTKAGYWLSYNRTAGTSPLTTITLQKIEQ
jgi:hypothetical protein